jgi:two-component system, NarL family, nitrate/nitrite response regulator NarL
VKDMETSLKKILVVDDHVIFREGLISLFRFSTDFEVVGGAGSVHESVEKANQAQPDIILMDFSLPDGNGLDATRAILAVRPDCKIVFLTVNESDQSLFAALRAGARGYLLKNVRGADILSSLRGLEREELAISRKMMSRVVEEFAHVPAAVQEKEGPGPSLLNRLSPREMEVLCELESGVRNDQIAQRLFLSENTVKHHIQNLFEKLGVDNRKQAAEIARQLGLRSKYAGKAGLAN